MLWWDIFQMFWQFFLPFLKFHWLVSFDVLNWFYFIVIQFFILVKCEINNCHWIVHIWSGTALHFL
jgi:hypothetical protein